VELISKLLGKALHDLESVATVKGQGSERAGEPVLRVRGLGKAGVLERFDLEIHAGEVLGLAGLLGSGRTELATLLFGIEKPDQGEVAVQGQKVRLNSPLRASSPGIGLCPEDRKSEGIIEDLSIRENIILALQVKQGLAQEHPRARQEEIAERYIKLLDIRTPPPLRPSRTSPAETSRRPSWPLAGDAAEPAHPRRTHPGDRRGRQAEIQKLILALSEKGMAVLFISSELTRFSCADRIAILAQCMSKLTRDRWTSRSHAHIAHDESGGAPMKRTAIPFAQGEDELWISALAPTSTPPGGFVEDEQARCVASQRATMAFCWFGRRGS